MAFWQNLWPQKQYIVTVRLAGEQHFHITSLAIDRLSKNREEEEEEENEQH